MMRSGRKILSLFLLVPILTILAHNSIPHHHHGSPVEVCCANQTDHSGSLTHLDSRGHTAANHHDACCFNPEFTFDLFKLLIAAPETEFLQIECPQNSVGFNYIGFFSCVFDISNYPAPNLLRGPPAMS
ncbi:MAG: hypothetical protein WC699_12540 [Bacteroidales bacterium]|jgi:hypothetical protein